MRGTGSKEGAPPGGREGEIRRRECENFAPRNGVTRVSGERGAKRKSHRAPGRSKSAGGNVKILPPERSYKGSREVGSKERAPPSAWEVEIRRRKCEDFAPRNGATRVRGEWGAKRGRPPVARPGTLRALFRNMYKKKLVFLYTIMYYHTNAIKNT